MRYDVLVRPSSKKGAFVQTSLTGELLVHVREPAVDGKANTAIIKLLANFFDVPKSSIEIIRGHTSRIKTINVMRKEEN